MAGAADKQRAMPPLPESLVSPLAVNIGKEEGNKFAPHEPSPTTRQVVQALSSFGVRQDDIAQYLDIDAKTLRLHYRRELDVGTTHANMLVAASLFEQATVGKSVAAAIFWLKARAGWRETQTLDIKGKLASGEVVPVVNIHLTQRDTIQAIEHQVEAIDGRPPIDAESVLIDSVRNGDTTVIPMKKPTRRG